MGKRRPITVGTMEFLTTKDATEWVQQIVDKYPNGENFSAVHTAFFKDLLELHPNCKDKVGVGVKGFVVNQNPVYPNRTVFIIRDDGSPCDFSWVKCLRGEQQETLRRQALRVAVVPQILAYKNTTLAPGMQHCEITGLRLTSDNCAVDHVAPKTFDVVVDDWLLAEGISLEAVQISPSRDLQYNRSMTNPAQIASWFQYHQAHAHLRLLSREAHFHLPKHKFKK
jgi:Protein of unknown function (DUF3223)